MPKMAIHHNTRQSTPAALPSAYVINMPGDEDRRAQMAARLDKTGVPYEFIEAVNGRAMNLEETPSYDGLKRRRYFGRDMMPGEMGCLLSHRKIYEKMVSEKIPYAVILEDDVIFEPDFKDVLNALLKTPVRWDVIRFLGSEKIYRRGCRIITSLYGRYSLARLPTAPGGAHGYLLSLHAAQVMLKHTQKNWLPIDTLQGRTWETGLETLVVYPAPLYPDQDAGSTIGDARFDKTVKLTGLNKALFPLTRAWFKTSENLGKRYVYMSSWLRDKKNGGHGQD